MSSAATRTANAAPPVTCWPHSPSAANPARVRECDSRTLVSCESQLQDENLALREEKLNINLNNTDLNESRRRIRMLADAFRKDGTRITENLDFSEVSA
jgi:hypothetical protein